MDATQIPQDPNKILPVQIKRTSTGRWMAVCPHTGWESPSFRNRSDAEERARRVYPGREIA